VTAEKADEEGHLDDIQVIDPDRGALTQILEEYALPGTPVIIENVVEQIDAIVRPFGTPAGRPASLATGKSDASSAYPSRTTACRPRATCSTGPTPTSPRTTEGTGRRADGR
jgi:hypothetical protein